MSSLIKTDVEDLEMQSRGLLVNTNNKAYCDYKRMTTAMNQKDSEMVELKSQINTLEAKFDMLLKDIAKEREK